MYWRQFQRFLYDHCKKVLFTRIVHVEECHDCKYYYTSLISYEDIFAVVTYNKDCDSYRLNVFSADSVPLFGPPLPSPPIFTNHQEFRDFLLVKCELQLQFNTGFT